VEKGFYARVSRLGTQWLELDLHFLSLGGGEIALGWWFEECLVPYLVNTQKLEQVQSISIVTGYGKTRLRGARQGDDGMRKRVRAMLKFMSISETQQPNRGRVHIDKQKLIEEVKRNGGRIVFDLEGYVQFKERETTANKFPDVEQKVRPRYRPEHPTMGGPPFIRVETDSTSPEFRRGDVVEPEQAPPPPQEALEGGRHGQYDDRGDRRGDRHPEDRYDDRYGGGRRRGSYNEGGGRYNDRRDRGDSRRGGYNDGGRYNDRRDTRRGSYNDGGGGGGRYNDRRDSYRQDRFDSRPRRSGSFGEDDRDRRRNDDGSHGRDDRRFNNDRGPPRGPSNWEPPAGVSNHFGNGEKEADNSFPPDAAARADPRIKEETSPASAVPIKDEPVPPAEGEKDGVAKKRNSYSGRGYSLEPSASKRTRTS